VQGLLRFEIEADKWSVSTIAVHGELTIRVRERSYYIRCRPHRSLYLSCPSP